jgi:Mg2+/Co2+ transporter CorB
MATLTVALAGAGVVSLLLVLSAFFSSSETAVFTVDRADIETQAATPQWTASWRSATIPTACS